MLSANPLARKLSAFAPLAAADLAALDLSACRHRRLDRGADIIQQDDYSRHVHLILSGVAGRFKRTEGGARQITAYMLPGDLCDLYVFILEKMDHSIGALSECEVVNIPQKTVLRWLSRPNLAQALWKSTLVDEAILRQWIVNLGRKSATGMLAHLFCELWVRMHTVGLTANGGFSLPLTQQILADTAGLSIVHVNRSLQELRGMKLIEIGGGELRILDAARLRRIADFEGDYLHLNERVPAAAEDAFERAPRRLDVNPAEGIG